MMKELACISVILFGLAAGKGESTPSYVPTVATAAAAVIDLPIVDLQLDIGRPLSCRNGRCGMSRQVMIKKSDSMHSSHMSSHSSMHKKTKRIGSRIKVFRNRLFRRR